MCLRVVSPLMRAAIVLNAAVLTFIASAGIAHAQGSGFQVLHHFTGNDGRFPGDTDGANPYAPLVQGPDGNFYGTTVNGSASATGPTTGTVFRMDASGTITILHHFSMTGIGDGVNPYAGLFRASDGNFYGTTYGSVGNTDVSGGTVFRISPEGAFTKLHTFTGPEGAYPYAGVVEGTDGNFYGTTTFGGTFERGAVFRMTPAGVVTALYSFTGATDGAQPFGGLVQGTDGNFYGVTRLGGSSGVGVLFRVTPAGTFTVMHTFLGSSGLDGAHPMGALIQAADGNFYGTTSAGGVDDNGTIFSMTPAGAYTVLHSFSRHLSGGATPHASLMQAPDGSFYGTTVSGGIFDFGTVFHLAPSGAVMTLHSFRNRPADDGTHPEAPLILGTHGKLYGTTRTGGLGLHDKGVVFRLDTVSAPVITLQPVDQSVVAGETATFTVAASGSPFPTYAWQVSGNGGASWTFAPYSGASTPTLTITPATLSLSGAQFRAIANNVFGSAVSNVATLTVTAPPHVPAILIEPVSQTVAEGETASFTVAATGDPAPGYQWEISTDSGVSWTNVPDAPPFVGVATATLTVTSASPDLNRARFRAVASNDAGSATSAAATLTVVTTGRSISVSHSSLFFGAVTDGQVFLAQTSAQIVRLIQTGEGTVTWTASTEQPWLTVSPTSGSGSADLSIGVIATGGLPLDGSVSGGIILTFIGATSDVAAIAVQLRTRPSGTSAGPFGVVDTPVDGGTGVSGAVPFTGWALDDIEVEGVTICRAAAGFEIAPVDPRCGGAAQIFIGDGVFVEGARPDVYAAFPTYPRATRAGWGFMVLTNTLPDVARGLPTGGNGTYTFFVYARDREDKVAVLGTRTLTCDNEHATLPFGTIDTPGQGEIVSGSSFVNFGWALTPLPKFIPTDGSTIQVFIDGVAAGSVSYDHFREDIAGAFPGLANSEGAVGFHMLDTTDLANGLHTIAWGVTDSAGAAEGLGSRYFTVSNGVAAAGESVVSGLSRTDTGPPEGGHHGDMESLPLDRHAIRGRRGWDLAALWRDCVVEATGHAMVRGEELDRFELQLAERTGETYAGYLRVGNEFAPLPIGSHLDASTGRFTWSPGVGFVGTYDLVFVRSSGDHAVARQEVRITLAPKGSGRLGPQVVIDTPSPVASGFRRTLMEQPFMLAGWAADLDSESGTGIDALHAWAHPWSGAPPIFLGVADSGGARPDVAAIYGEQFRESGYGLIVQGLAQGNYDLAVFAWSTVQGGFMPAQVVRITVR